MNEYHKLTHLKYRADIDGLRAVAVFAVVLFHAFPEAIKGGFVGVDIFFVISGFLISTILLQNLELEKFKFADFYSRRIRRIFPALIIVLIACWIAGWFTLLPDEFMQLGKHIMAGASFISNLMLWNESGYFDSSSDVKPLLHLWSLGIEEQFYIFWPLITWIAWKRKIHFLYIAIAVAIISFSLNVWGIKNDLIGVFYSPITRIWELLSGSIIAWVLFSQNLVSKKILDEHRNTLSVLGLTAIIASIILFNKEILFPGWWAIVPVFGACALIFSGPNSILNRLILSNKYLVAIGLISYPLYLWHWPLLVFAKIINVEVSIWMRIEILILSIALAIATYKFIEKPIRFGGKNKLKVMLLVVLMTLVGYAGYAAYIRDGIPINRVKIRSSNALLNQMLTFKFNPGPAYRVGSCMLTEKQGPESLKNCNNQEDPSKKSILIWGDSHGGHLYPGYMTRYSNEYNILQRTASGCPPALGYDTVDRLFCKEINEATIQYIEKIKPDRVVLAGNWSRYGLILNQLSETVKRLKKLGIKKIDLVGQVPRWENNLPKQILLYCKKNTPCQIPEYMSFGLIKDIEIDDKLRSFSLENGINYFSPYQILCNSEGCLIRTGNTGDSITAWDSEHLTYEGSNALVSKFKTKD